MSIGFSTHGNGPTHIVMLHGWLSDSTVFDQIVPFFDPEKYTLALMDYRGYGTSKDLEGEYTTTEIADDAMSMVDELKWDKFHVIGHSMGGIVLQRMALLAPDRIASGIAITPVPASGFDLDADTTGFFQSSAEDDAALTEIFNILTGQRHAHSILSGLTRSARNSTSTAAYLGYLAAWTQSDFAADVAGIQTPICVIAGAHDGALGPDHMRETYLKQLPNAQMKIIDAAGHYPMLETPFELFNMIETSLGEQA